MFRIGERERLARCFRRLAEKSSSDAACRCALCEAHNTAGGAPALPGFFRTEAFHNKAKLASVAASAPMAVANPAVQTQSIRLGRPWRTRARVRFFVDRNRTCT